MKQFKAAFIDANGQNQEVELAVEMYREAEQLGLSLPQFLAHKFPTRSEDYGSTFEQMLAAAGVYLQYDAESGLRPPTIAQVLNSDVQMATGAITRPDGTGALTVSGRLLFPAVVLQMIESELRANNGAYAAVFNQLVGQTISVATPRYDQPIINVTRPRDTKSSPIAQLSEPNRMLSITLSEKSKRMPVFSIGMEISDEAARASAIDLVGIAVREQTLQERADLIDSDLKAMIVGDTDTDQTALASFAASTLDSGATNASTFSQKAWVKFLRQSWKKRNLNWVLAHIDDYMVIEGRTGRPNSTNQTALDERLNPIPQAANPGVPDRVNVFLIESAATLGGAGRIVGLDSRVAIRKIIYAAATYQAIEAFVLRRSTALRYDWSERHERFGYDDAWSVMTF